MGDTWLTALIDELSARKFAGDHDGADRAICLAAAEITGLTAETALALAELFIAANKLRRFAELAKEKP